MLVQKLFFTLLFISGQVAFAENEDTVAGAVAGGAVGAGAGYLASPVTDKKTKISSLFIRPESTVMQTQIAKEFDRNVQKVLRSQDFKVYQQKNIDLEKISNDLTDSKIQGYREYKREYVKLEAELMKEQGLSKTEAKKIIDELPSMKILLESGNGSPALKSALNKKAAEIEAMEKRNPYLLHTHLKGKFARNDIAKLVIDNHWNPEKLEEVRKRYGLSKSAFKNYNPVIVRQKNVAGAATLILGTTAAGALLGTGVSKLADDQPDLEIEEFPQVEQ